MPIRHHQARSLNVQTQSVPDPTMIALVFLAWKTLWTASTALLKTDMVG